MSGISARDRYGGSDVKRKPRRTDGIVGDSTLQRLWRKVVRWEWDYKCALSGKHTDDDGWTHDSDCEGLAECHHIIPRARPHLKHVPSNGVLLCQKHHKLIRFPSWRRRLEEAVGEDKMEFLESEARKMFPEFLKEHGWTRREWSRQQKAYLEGLLKEATSD